MTNTRYSSTSQGPSHPDFQLPWVQEILSTPGLEFFTEREQGGKGNETNSLFTYTLSQEYAIRARLSFSRPCTEPDAVSAEECCFLLSISWGVDGKTGRAHGGFSALLMDHVTGTVANRTAASKEDPPATATMTVDYKAPIDTPGLVIARAWATEISGRKVWLKGVIQGEDGKVYATAKALFIQARRQAPTAKI